MKGLLITTYDEITIRDYQEPLHRTIGEDVGGYIEVVTPVGALKESRLIMIVNEEGRFKDLPVNLVGTAIFRAMRPPYSILETPIVGDIVLMTGGKNEHGEMEIRGIPDDELKELYDGLKKAFGMG